MPKRQCSATVGGERRCSHPAKWRGWCPVHVPGRLAEELAREFRPPAMRPSWLKHAVKAARARFAADPNRDW